MKNILKKSNNFDSVDIRLASPEDILAWSFGEVTKPETINYRTQRAEIDGLFCQKIFGPEVDFQCSCGKYKGNQYQGIVCNNCGVEVSKSFVRRERMGHIKLATPIAHIWFLKKTPSRIALLLGIPTNQVQKVVYFSSYYILEVNKDKVKKTKENLKKEFDKKIDETKQKETQIMLKNLYQDRVRELDSIKEGEIIDEADFERLNLQFSTLFKAEKGGKVIYDLLKKINLKAMEKKIKLDMETASKGQCEKLQKQLQVVRSFIQSGNKPEWMFLNVLPVIPPGIRPVVLLDRGQYASSDLNDLYRLILIRNNRLKEFIDTNAPKIFINTQKRLLQESVDALFEKDPSSRTLGGASRSQSSKQLKPISEYISGKSGYFRSNLLGKRVDFTGRSVIVVGQHLKIDEFGLPKIMALEIFRPFIIGEILERELAYNVRGAQRLMDSHSSVIWEILEKITKDKYMLLNRQPTLHRQGIQAFKPILIEGLAIELHPLACDAYNADFDGDTMVTYLPLSEEAQMEAKSILLSSKNIIKPASGEINKSPATRDILLGCYWSTYIKKGVLGTGKNYCNVNEAIIAYDFGGVDIRAEISVLIDGKLKKTSVGRVLFNETLPKEYEFVNEVIDKNKLNEIIESILNDLGSDVLIEHLDTIKEFGFKYASKSGITFSWEELKKPSKLEETINGGYEETKKTNDTYNEGLISINERIAKNIETWQGIKANLTEKIKKEIDENSSLGNMIISGTRGSFGDLCDMIGMFGVVDSSSGEPIEQAVTSSLKDGMNPIEYFNASFGARKGLADTALKTADAGYLSRKLFDVAQEIKIEGKDCGTIKGYRIYRNTVSGVGDPFFARITGRYIAEDINDTKGNNIIKKNKYINEELAKEIEIQKTVISVKVRSPLTCTYSKGVCAKCYGRDVASKKIIDIGESVGTIAAQSVGEPGTQLTMRTFHAGGVASVTGDITSGLPRVTEIFERRTPKSPATLSHVDGIVVQIEKNVNNTNLIHIKAKNNPDDVHKFIVNVGRFIEVKVGDIVVKGQCMTDGSIDIQELLKYRGKEATQKYIFGEINKVYELQGVSIAPVHFEVIIRQMFSRLIITDSGDSVFTEGEMIELSELTEINERFEKEGKDVIKAENVVVGIANVSTSRSNFLSAASFQNTTSVLIRASINGLKDTLDGVKENVIIGRLVPVGSGYEGSEKFNIIKKVRDKIEEKILKKREIVS